MRLREQKCKNCGASIKVGENETQVECKYCHTTFVVEDAYYDGYKFEKGRMKARSERLETNFVHARNIIGPIGKIFAAQYIISAIIWVVIFIIAIVTIIVFDTKQINSIDEFDVRRFNNHYEIYNGTEYGSSVGRLIDTIITNNKKDAEHIITIKYKDVITKKPEKMKEIKKQLDEWTKYEVTFEYDKNGFIYMATIEE